MRKSACRLEVRQTARTDTKASQNLCNSKNKIKKHFVPGRVPGAKYLTGCKCGIFTPIAKKLCAQQTAKTGGKARKGFFDK